MTDTRPPLRAYMASALTDLPDAVREEVYQLCQEVKAECRKHGIVLYLPFEHTDPHAHSSVPAPIVYATDSKHVITSDLLFILCVAASYGVGQENQIALSQGVPVVYLVKRGSRVSRMLLGSPTRSCTIEYDSEEDLLKQLAAFLPGTADALRKRREALGDIGSHGVGNRVKDLRERNEVSRETLADLLGVRVDFISQLEDDEQFEGRLTLCQIHTLTALLGESVEYLLTGATGRISERMQRSKKNLECVAEEEDMLFADFKRLWEAYLSQQRAKIGFVAATRIEHIVGKEQWREWYRKLLDKQHGGELQF